MRTWFQRQRVYVQLALIASLTLLFTALSMGLAYRRAADNAKITLRHYGNDLVAQLTQTLETHYNAYATIVRLLSSHQVVQAFLLSPEGVVRDGLTLALQRTLNDVAALNAQIVDIILQDGQGRRYDLSDSSIALPALDLSDHALHVSNLLCRKTGSTQEDVIVLSKAIFSLDRHRQTDQQIGSVHLALTSSAFTGNPHASHSDLLLFLVDGAGQLLWGSDAKATQAAYDEAVSAPNAQYYYHAVTLRQPPYPVLALQAKPSALFSSGNWQTAYLFTFATLMIVGIVCWICWARNLVRPLRHLLLFLGKLQRGTLSGLEKRVLLTGYQEAAVIGNEFNNLLEKTRLLTAELVRANSALYEKELLARQAELSHLRSQINPHFLYNTLETMVGIAYVNGQPALAEIARALGHLFAFSIKGGETVTLEAEFQIARDYLHIQRFRFSDRFDVCYDVSDACLQKMVPKMILQPLIENAIVHGIESQDRFCHLRVGAALAQDALCLTVTDDGAGMSEHTLLSIRARLQDDASAVQDSSHIGLFNVDRRIKLLYGRLYGITLASVQDHGTTVTITLPMPKEDCACTKCSL